ncbi:MAG: hypothetical protein L6R41_002345, partial [Letrouitia leprolyta]
MPRTPLSSSLFQCRELFQISNLQPSRTRGLCYGPNISTQWVCRRCQSRLAKAIPPAKPIIRTRNLFPSKEVLRITHKNTFSSTGHQNDTPPNTTPEPPSSPQPNSSTTSPLPSHTESLRSPLSRRLTHLLDTLQNSTINTTQHLNHLTGYTGIESLKTSITAQESHLQACRSRLASARTAYTAAINNRFASQREVNTLLQRKHAWSPSDLERFTELYRSDHENELQETQAHATLIQAEKEAEDAGARLSESILKRYHEEQIWSDKIRRMSTWGTWGLMGVNVLLFLVFQLGLEPWRRGRLVRGFEEKVREALEEGRRSVDLRVDVTGSGGEDVKVDWVTGVRKEADGMVQERVVEKSGIAGGVESGQ